MLYLVVKRLHAINTIDVDDNHDPWTLCCVPSFISSPSFLLCLAILKFSLHLRFTFCDCRHSSFAEKRTGVLLLQIRHTIHILHARAQLESSLRCLPRYFYTFTVQRANQAASENAKLKLKKSFLGNTL